ncbi:MAG: WG repeat-containing protein [Bdellovibrionales bacterium]|nr:WG repeat-containing protein [Bdellovibrionales bacterium]
MQLKDTILIDKGTLTDGISVLKNFYPLLDVIIPKINLSDGVKRLQLNPWRYIDKQNNFSEKKFMSAKAFSEGLATAITLFFPSLDPKFFKIGYIDKSMQFVFTIDTEKVQSIRDFSEGLAAAKREDKWGYIDKTPKWVLSPIYDKVGDFNEGLAWVEIDGKYGYINKETKKFFIEPKFDGAGDFSEGLAPVKVDDEWGYISKETKNFSIPPEFAFAGKFTEGLAPVLKINGWFSDDKWGYINKEKKFVIRAKFDGAGNFSEGLAIVAEKKDDEVKHGYIMEWPPFLATLIDLKILHK